MMPGWGPAEPPEPTIEGLINDVVELRKKLESEKLRCDEVFKAGCKLSEAINKERYTLRLEKSRLGEDLRHMRELAEDWKARHERIVSLVSIQAMEAQANELDSLKFQNEAMRQALTKINKASLLASPLPYPQKGVKEACDRVPGLKENRTKEAQDLELDHQRGVCAEQTCDYCEDYRKSGLEKAVECSSCGSTVGVQLYCPKCYTDV